MNTDQLLVIYLDDRAEKTPVLVEQKPGQDRLNFLQTLVEGLIECVALDQTTELWVNEEGLFRGDFQVNATATDLARFKTGLGYTLVGPAVITGGVDREGNTLSVTDLTLAMISGSPGLAPGIWTTDDILASRSTETEMA